MFATTVFLAVPALMGCAVLYGMARTARKVRRILAIWRSGHTAEAMVVRKFTKVHGSGERTSTTLHHVYEFTGPEGRPVRFEEAGGPVSRVQGDVLVAHYHPADPQAATVRAPGDSRMLRVAVGQLAFLSVVLVFVAAFAFFAFDYVATVQC